MDQTQVVLAVVNVVMEIVARHREASNLPPYTDAEVAAMKAEALADGQTRIAAWFVSKGLTPPE